MTSAREQEAIENRFWSKVDKSGDCWMWTAGTIRGYGQFSPSRRVNVPAHRFAYEALVGPIPDGLVIDHLCRVPSCVNPDHMEPVTIRENVLRGVGLSALNVVKTHCPRGHAFSDENTLVTREGTRRCRICRNEQTRQAKLRMKARRKAMA